MTAVMFKSNTWSRRYRHGNMRRNNWIKYTLLSICLLSLISWYRSSQWDATKLSYKSNIARCSFLSDITKIATKNPKALLSITKLDLKDCNLENIPPSIKLLTNLQELDISNNPLLSTLPEELAQCQNLSTLFASGCPGMTELPRILGKISSLTRLGWRSGSIMSLNADSLPPNLIHLILTNNKITSLDDERVYEKLTNVRKLMLSHNSIETLSPDGVALLQKLELFRLAGNNLREIPDTLWALPKLTWITISGNPLLGLPTLEKNVPELTSFDELLPASDNLVLGEGASGKVRAYKWKDEDVALKIIHGVTSDGTAEDEIQIYSAVGSQSMEHRVVGCLATLQAEDPQQHQNVKGVVMKRISSDLEDLALPPTIVEVTRDRWGPSTFEMNFVLNAVRDAAEALRYLHKDVGVAHGDVYAHNMKVDRSSGRLYLLDFGASYATGAYSKMAEKVEVRALGILIGELLRRVVVKDDDKQNKEIKGRLVWLKGKCVNEDVTKRLTFHEIVDYMNNYAHS